MAAYVFATGQQVTGDMGENITALTRSAVGYHLHLKNLGPNVAYIGSNLTGLLDYGFPLSPGEKLAIWVPPGVSPLGSAGGPESEYVYAICATGEVANIAFLHESRGPSYL